MQDLQVKARANPGRFALARGRALRTATLKRGRRPEGYASDVPHVDHCNIAVSDDETNDRWVVAPPKWAVPFSWIVVLWDGYRSCGISCAARGPRPREPARH